MYVGEQEILFTIRGIPGVDEAKQTENYLSAGLIDTTKELTDNVMTPDDTVILDEGVNIGVWTTAAQGSEAGEPTLSNIQTAVNNLRWQYQLSGVGLTLLLRSSRSARFPHRGSIRWPPASTSPLS